MWRFAFVFLLALRAFGAETSNFNALEERFRSSLSNCVLNGRWCLIEKGKLTEEYQDRYTIQAATKSGKDVWLIYARVEYGGKDLTVPVPVQVHWAGDTPIISLDRVSIPGLGTYSARVMIYENTYAGTWSAGDHGGMLHGMIERPAKPTPSIAKQPQAPKIPQATGPKVTPLPEKK